MSTGLELAPRIDLLEQLRDKLRQAWRQSHSTPLIRAEVAAPGLDAAAWLAAQSPGARGYWSDREQSFALAGIGRADWIIGQTPAELPSLLRELHERLDGSPQNIRYFGGFSFDPLAPLNEEWGAFGHYRFILPRVEVITRDGHTVLACNARREEAPQQVETELAGVRFPAGPPAGTLPALLSRTDAPPRDEWARRIGDALGQIGEGQLRKVVLARRASLECTAPPDPAHLLLRLRARAVAAFHFCFQPDPHHAFVGASPERLYRRDGSRLSTEAIAGTRPRGATPEEDARLCAALLDSEKDRREHAMVVEGIRSAVSPLVTDMDVEAEPRLLKLSHNQHLIVSIQGRLRDGVQDSDLLSALHPTPAVGGLPTTEALDFLRRRENFSRGWYAAPIGWVSRDAAQFAVGIRSALVSRKSLHLYSGAGIVSGSDPESEWAEIENKIAHILDLFPHIPPA